MIYLSSSVLIHFFAGIQMSVAKVKKTKKKNGLLLGPVGDRSARAKAVEMWWEERTRFIDRRSVDPCQ